MSLGLTIFIIQIRFKVDEAVLDENQLAWFASCLVIGQVEKLKQFHLSCSGYCPMDKAEKNLLYLQVPGTILGPPLADKVICHRMYLFLFKI